MYHKGIPFAEHNFSPFQDIFFVIVLFESQSKTLFRVLFLSLYLQICIFYFGISKYLNFTRELRRRFDRKYTLDLPKHCVVKSYRSGNVSLNTDLRFARPKIRGWEAQNEGLMKIMSKRCGIRPPGGRNS